MNLREKEEREKERRVERERERESGKTPVVAWFILLYLFFQASYVCVCFAWRFVYLHHRNHGVHIVLQNTNHSHALQTHKVKTKKIGKNRKGPIETVNSRQNARCEELFHDEQKRAVAFFHIKGRVSSCFREEERPLFFLQSCAEYIVYYLVV